ncbi:MAG: putative membrane protein (4 TMH) [Parcubacteria bacterium C7867-004]|nr:MAG: putative membrane protein (4 TMH) [Parcubacteria bacterium C7867-004]
MKPMSHRFPWLIATLLVAAVVGVLEQWAITDFLYWRYTWFDIVMHFLGGLTIGLALVALIGSRFRPVWFLVLMIAVAVGWEVFEALVGIPREANFKLDTALDLLMDTLGALLAYGIARFTLWRSA